MTIFLFLCRESTFSTFHVSFSFTVNIFLPFDDSFPNTVGQQPSSLSLVSLLMFLSLSFLTLLESLQCSDDQVLFFPPGAVCRVRSYRAACGFLILCSDQKLHVFNVVAFPLAFRIEVGRVTDENEKYQR